METGINTKNEQRKPKYKKKGTKNRVSVSAALTPQYFSASVKVKEPPLYM